MGGSPTSSVKRAEKAEREIAAAPASDATDHGCTGSRWTSEHGLADALVFQHAQPAGLAFGLARRSTPDRLDHQDVGQPGDDRLTPGSQHARLGGDEAQGGMHPLGPGHGPQAARHLDDDRPRQEHPPGYATGMANRTVPQTMLVAAPPPPCRSTA